MKIFLSWSGERSRAVANALKRWLPDVIQTLDVWMSAHDIDAGARWNAELDTILQSSHFGVLCVTSDNQAAPWLLFEAGALAKSPKIARVIPYLVGLSPTDVQFPLAQFQGVEANREGTYRLLQTVNDAGALGITVEKLERAFARWWPDLESELYKVPASDTRLALRRSDRDLLEEILGLLRSSTQCADKQLKSLSSSVEQRHTSEHADEDGAVISIDTRPLLGKAGKQMKMAYDADQTVSRFLDSVFFLISRDGHISPYTYGNRWLLEEPTSGRRFDDIGIEYCRSGGKLKDKRSIASVGISQGAELNAIALTQPLWGNRGVRS